MLIGLFYWQYPQYFSKDYWYPEKKEARMPKMFWDIKGENHLDNIVDLQDGDFALVYDNGNKYFQWYIYRSGDWVEIEPAELKGMRND